MSYDPQMDPEEDVPPGKVKLICHSCGARYLVPEGKVRGRRFRASCKRCGGIIVARYDKGSFTVLPDSGGDAQQRRAKRPSAALRLQSSDLAEDRDSTDDGWYVVIGGEPRGPFSAAQIEEELHAGRIGERNYAWREGEADWVRLQQIPALSPLLTGERTGFYEAEEPGLPMRREPTSETIAGGPKGRRHEDEEHEDGEDGYPDFRVDDPTYGSADYAPAAGGPEPYDRDEGRETYGGYREEDDYDGRQTAYYDEPDPQAHPRFDDRPEHSAEATRLHGTAPRQELPIRPARTGEVRDPDRWSREVDMNAWGAAPGKVQREQLGQAGRYAQARPEAPPPGEHWGDDISEPRLWASPRRPAALPAPPGARRAVVPAPPPPPAAALPPSSDYTRPLSDDERRVGVPPAPPAAAFGGPPAFTPPPPLPGFSAPSAPLPVPSAFGPSAFGPSAFGPSAFGAASAFGAQRPAQPENSDLLPSLVPAVPASTMAPPKLLLPTKEPFWSVGKIVLATAIGSALLICLTVGVVALAIKSRRPRVAMRLPSSVQLASAQADEGDPPKHAPSASSATAAAPAPASKPAPAAAPVPTNVGAKTPAAAPAPAPVPAPAPAPAPASVTAKASPPPSARIPAPIPAVETAPTPPRKPARRVRGQRRSYQAARRPPRRARRTRRGSSRDDVAALVGGGGGGGSSADDVLAAAGGTSRRKARPKRRAPTAAADDVLAAAGGGGGSAKPRSLDREQVRQGMRRLNGHVRGCFDTHKQAGQLALRVTIQPSGRASGRVLGRFAGSPTGSCVERGVPRLRFPSFSGAAMTFTYPFTLQ